MGMKLENIKTKIGRRVGDPLLDTYEDEVQDYFEQAFATLLRKTGDKDLIPIYLNEIAPSLKRKAFDISPNNRHLSTIEINKTTFPSLMKIFAIDVLASSAIQKVFTYIDIANFELILKNSNVVPPSFQGYWTSDGVDLKIYSSSDSTSLSIVQVKYIENPIPSDWGTDFVSDMGYGYGFISDCIELASSLLRRQIGIEG